MKSASDLIRRLVVVLVFLPGCSGKHTSAEKGQAPGGDLKAAESDEGAPAHWVLQESKLADSFFGKGPRVRLFVGGPPAVYGMHNDPGAPIRLNAQEVVNCGWKEDDDLIYSVRFESAAATTYTGTKTVPERLKMIASFAASDALLRWSVVENSFRDLDHHGRAAREMEYSRNAMDMAKSPLSIVVRIVAIEELELICFMQVSSRKPGPALRAADPKVRAFLTRSEIVVPKKAEP